MLVGLHFGDLGQKDPHVATRLEQVAQRLADVAGREATDRHLIEERLKEMEVAPVDEGDTQLLGLGEGLYRADAPEPAPDHHHVMVTLFELAGTEQSDLTVRSHTLE